MGDVVEVNAAKASGIPGSARTTRSSPTGHTIPPGRDPRVRPYFPAGLPERLADADVARSTVVESRNVTHVGGSGTGDVCGAMRRWRMSTRSVHASSQ